MTTTTNNSRTTNGKNKTFPGWTKPEKNFSELPHEFIKLLPHLNGSETKVLLYILRHTWGFQEFDQSKKITIDEFMNGRKQRTEDADGNPILDPDTGEPRGPRMDGGTGLSNRGVIDTLKALVERGLLIVEVDDHDKARIKHYYMLAMKSDVKKAHVQVKKAHSRGEQLTHRTEKETEEKNNQSDQADGLIDSSLSPVLASPVSIAAAPMRATGEAFVGSVPVLASKHDDPNLRESSLFLYLVNEYGWTKMSKSNAQRLIKPLEQADGKSADDIFRQLGRDGPHIVDDIIRWTKASERAKKQGGINQSMCITDLVNYLPDHLPAFSESGLPNGLPTAYRDNMGYLHMNSQEYAPGTFRFNYDTEQYEILS